MRPAMMVTGELHPGAALTVSVVLLTAVTGISYSLNPWAVAPVVAGILLNVLYEYAKAWSLVANLDFSNQALKNLLESAGCSMVTRDEGIRELREAVSAPPAAGGSCRSFLFHMPMQ